ncbi:MAG: alanine racemase [Rhodothermales bacterium]
MAEVSVGRLKHNVAVVRRRLGDAGLIAVVKADAYGHGATRIARELAALGIEWFGVATVEEAIALRRSGIEGRILVMTAPLEEHLDAFPLYELDATVSSASMADAIINAGGRVAVHLKVDTGMGRIGVSAGEAEEVVRRLEKAPHVDIAGIWTHFASADEQDLAFTYEQLDRFDAVVARVGDAAAHIHVANTAAALRVPESLAYGRAMARIGLGLYGYTGLDDSDGHDELLPVMTVTSRVVHVKTVEPGTPISYGQGWTATRTTRIATVGAGYADGYHRALSNRSSVGIHGDRYPVTGAVCMDTFMVDLGPDSDVSPGDVVVLFGEGGPDAAELGSRGDTIPYEILTSVSGRVPRLYV